MLIFSTQGKLCRDSQVSRLADPNEQLIDHDLRLLKQKLAYLNKRSLIAKKADSQRLATEKQQILSFFWNAVRRRIKKKKMEKYLHKYALEQQKFLGSSNNNLTQATTKAHLAPTYSFK